MLASCSHRRRLIRDLPQINSGITRQFLTGNEKRHAASPIRNVRSWSLLRLRGQRMSSKEKNQILCQGSVQTTNIHTHTHTCIHTCIHAAPMKSGASDDGSHELSVFGPFCSSPFRSGIFFCISLPFPPLIVSLAVTDTSGTNNKRYCVHARICMYKIRHTSQNDWHFAVYLNENCW